MNERLKLLLLLKKQRIEEYKEALRLHKKRREIKKRLLDFNHQ